MINKSMFNKINAKKVLHKVHKSWVVVSLALLMAIGGGALAASTVNADSVAIAHTSNIPVSRPVSHNRPIMTITRAQKAPAPVAPRKQANTTKAPNARLIQAQIRAANHISSAEVNAQHASEEASLHLNPAQKKAFENVRSRQASAKRSLVVAKAKQATQAKKPSAKNQEKAVLPTMAVGKPAKPKRIAEPSASANHAAKASQPNSVKAVSKASAKASSRASAKPSSVSAKSSSVKASSVSSSNTTKAKSSVAKSVSSRASVKPSSANKTSVSSSRASVSQSSGSKVNSSAKSAEPTSSAYTTDDSSYAPSATPSIVSSNASSSRAEKASAKVTLVPKVVSHVNSSASRVPRSAEPSSVMETAPVTMASSSQAPVSPAVASMERHGVSASVAELALSLEADPVPSSAKSSVSGKTSDSAKASSVDKHQTKPGYIKAGRSNFQVQAMKNIYVHSDKKFGHGNAVKRIKKGTKINIVKAVSFNDITRLVIKGGGYITANTKLVFG